LDRTPAAGYLVKTWLGPPNLRAVEPGSDNPPGALSDGVMTQIDASWPSPAVQDCAKQLTALFKFNEVSLTEGFEQFDEAETGKVKLEEFIAAYAMLELPGDADAVQGLFKHMDTNHDGIIEEPDWAAVLNRADPTDVLKDRGLSLPGTPQTTNRGFREPDEAVLGAIKELSELIEFNEMTVQEGFGTFDRSETGQVTLDDFRVVTEELQLDFDAPLQQRLFEFMDADRRNAISLQNWEAAMSFAPTKTAPSSKEPEADVLDALNQLAALLQFNEMSVQDGYESFDQSEKGAVSFTDFEAVVQDLQLSFEAPLRQRVFLFMHPDINGAISLREWEEALDKADPDAAKRVLEERGVAPVQAPDAEILDALNQLAALLQYNEMTVQEGYESFDRSEKGAVTLADFEAVIQELQLPFSLALVQRVFLFIHPDADGTISLPEWEAALSKADAGEAERLLAERGVSSAAVPGPAPEADVQDALNQLSALLKFNEMTVDEGFESFDRSERGAVSLSDFEAIVQELQLAFSGALQRRVFTFMHPDINGTVSLEEWRAALANADPNATRRMLAARGVAARGEEEDERAVPSAEVQDALNQIVALLTFNKMSVQEGYDTFDRSERGVSIDDFEAMVGELQLSFSPALCQRVFLFMSPNGNGNGTVSLAEWEAALNQVDPVAVKHLLADRGVDVGEDLSCTEPLPAAPEHPDEDVLDAINELAALLRFNDMTVAEGFDSFDQTERGHFDLMEFTAAVHELGLQFEAPLLDRTHRFMDADHNGVVTLREWEQAMSHSNPARVAQLLRDRGVDVKPDPDVDTMPDPDVADALSQIRALLTYNEMTVQEGYESFDRSEQGAVCLADFEAVVEELQLVFSPELRRAVFRFMHPDIAGAISLEEWQTALSKADPAVTKRKLEERGVALEEDDDFAAAVTAPLPPASSVLDPDVQDALNQLAALLRFNEMTVEQGYESFDRSGNGFITLADFNQDVGAGGLLLDLARQERVFQFMAGDGNVVRLANWQRALAQAQPDKVAKLLQDRGADASLESGSLGGRSESSRSVRPVKSLQEAVNMLVAVIVYNHLNVDKAFLNAFNIQNTSRVTKNDFIDVAKRLNLKLSTADLGLLHQHLDTDNDGVLDINEWRTGLRTAQPAEVLKVLGISTADADTEVAKRAAEAKERLEESEVKMVELERQVKDGAALAKDLSAKHEAAEADAAKLREELVLLREELAGVRQSGAELQSQLDTLSSAPAVTALPDGCHAVSAAELQVFGLYRDVAVNSTASDLGKQEDVYIAVAAVVDTPFDPATNANVDNAVWQQAASALSTAAGPGSSFEITSVAAGPQDNTSALTGKLFPASAKRTGAQLFDHVQKEVCQDASAGVVSLELVEDHIALDQVLQALGHAVRAAPALALKADDDLRAEKPAEDSAAVAELRDRVAELETQLEASKTQVAESHARVAELEAQLEAAKAEADGTVAESRARVAELEAQLEACKAVAAEAEGALRDRVAELETQLEASKAAAGPVENEASARLAELHRDLAAHMLVAIPAFADLEDEDVKPDVSLTLQVEIKTPFAEWDPEGVAVQKAESAVERAAGDGSRFLFNQPATSGPEGKTTLCIGKLSPANARRTGRDLFEYVDQLVDRVGGGIGSLELVEDAMPDTAVIAHLERLLIAAVAQGALHAAKGTPADAGAALPGRKAVGVRISVDQVHADVTATQESIAAFKQGVRGGVIAAVGDGSELDIEAVEAGSVIVVGRLFPGPQVEETAAEVVAGLQAQASDEASALRQHPGTKHVFKVELVPDTLEASEAELSKVKADSAAAAAQVTSLTEELAATKATLASLEDRAKSAESEAAKVAEGEAAAQAKAVDLEERLKTAEEKLVEAEKKVSEAEAAAAATLGAKGAALEQAKNDAEAKAAEFEAKAKEAEERAKTAETELASKVETSAATAAKAAELDAKLADLDAKLAASDAKAAEGKAALEAAETQVAQLKADLAAALDAKAKAKAQVEAEMEEATTRLKAEVKRLTEQEAEGLANMREHVQTVAKLEAQVSNLKLQAEGYQEAVAQGKKEREALYDASQAAQREADQIRSQKRDVEGQVESLRTKLQTAEMARDSATDAKQRLEAALRDEESERKRLAALAQSLESQHSSANAGAAAAAAAATAALGIAQRDAQSAREEVSQLHKKVSELEHSLHVERRAKDDIQAHAQRDIAARAELESNLARMRNELRQYRESGTGGMVEQLKEENAASHAQIHQLSNEVLGLTKALEEVTKKAQLHCTEAANLQGRIRRAEERAARRRAPVRHNTPPPPRPQYHSSNLSEASGVGSDNGTDFDIADESERVPYTGASSGAAARGSGPTPGARPRPQSARARMEKALVSPPRPAGPHGVYDSPPGMGSGADRMNYTGAQGTGAPRTRPNSARARLGVVAKPRPRREYGDDALPFHALVRAVEDGELTQSTPIDIVVEYCMDCYLHDSSLRHDPAKYAKCLRLVDLSLKDCLQAYKWRLVPNPPDQNDDGRPRLGAFEIFAEWPDGHGDVTRVVVFSKLESLCFPNSHRVAQRLAVALENRGDILEDGDEGLAMSPRGEEDIPEEIPARPTRRSGWH